MIEKKYALPGKLNDEEIKEMQRFKVMDDPYVHRTNIIAGILHYLGTYCWPSIMTSYYDEDIKSLLSQNSRFELILNCLAEGCRYAMDRISW